MGVILKILSSPALRAIISQLLAWLVSECAAFVSKYLNTALPIIRDAEALKTNDGEALPGPEKFAWAKQHLIAELKAQGVEARGHYADTLIQAAVGVVKAEADKLAAKAK